MPPASDSDGPEPQERHFDIAATLEGVSDFGAILGAQLPDALTADQRSSIELAVGEALVNIVRHGYAGQPGRIAIRLVQREGSITLELRDWGTPISREALDASAASPFDFDPENPQSIPESGMGLPLIRLAVDELSYAAQGAEGNRLVLIKNFRRS